MSISRELLNKITSKLDIVEIVSSSGVTLTKKGQTMLVYALFMMIKTLL